jgi:hypothetical protein
MVMETGNEEEASCSAGRDSGVWILKTRMRAESSGCKGSLSRRKLTPEVVVTPTHGSRVS